MLHRLEENGDVSLQFMPEDYFAGHTAYPITSARVLRVLRFLGSNPTAAMRGSVSYRDCDMNGDTVSLSELELSVVMQSLLSYTH